MYVCMYVLARITLNDFMHRDSYICIKKIAYNFEACSALCMRMDMCVCVCVCMNAPAQAIMRMYAYMCVCTYVCMNAPDEAVMRMRLVW